MKIKSLLTAAAITLFTIPAFGQSVVTNFTDFTHGLLSYFASFNTNLDNTFGASRVDVWVGASSIQGAAQPLVNDIGVSYDIWRPTPAAGSAMKSALSLENVIRNSGVAGTLTTENLGLSFSLIFHDVKFGVYAEAGYLFEQGGGNIADRFYGEAGFRVKKALSSHFFLGSGLGAQFPRNGQVFSVFSGFSF